MVTGFEHVNFFKKNLHHVKELPLRNYNNKFVESRKKIKKILVRKINKFDFDLYKTLSYFLFF